MKIFYFLSFAILWCHAIIDQKTVLDLEILPRDSRASLASVVDATVTIQGRKALEQLLLNPTTDTACLHKRQTFVQRLCKDADFYNALHAHLSALVPDEAVLAAQNSFPDDTLQGVYFSSSKLQEYNASPYLLDLGYLAHIVGLCAPLAEYVVLHAGIEFFGKHEHAGQPCDHGNYAMQALLFGVHVPSLWEMSGSIKKRALLVKSLQQHMIHASNYMFTAKNIYTTLSGAGVNEQQVPALASLEKFVGESPTCSPLCTKLLTYLENSTFWDEASVFNHVGHVLATYALYRQAEKELDELKNALGEIDAYVATATLIKKQQENAPWCFATYSDSMQPTITAHTMRHLFIPEDKSRSWHVEYCNSKHIFITGNNGAGKSTVINALGHAILLAQTVGIVPAASFEITPFSHLVTYRFMQDNIFEGMSHFYAECARIEEIFETITHSNKLACVLIDEPFTGTHMIKGAQHLEQALDRLYAMPHVISFTASHYHSMCSIIGDYSQAKHVHLQ